MHLLSPSTVYALNFLIIRSGFIEQSKGQASLPTQAQQT
jgi:hypothetical protein